MCTRKLGVQCGSSSDDTPILRRPEEQSLPLSTGGASYGQDGDCVVGDSAEHEPMADMERSRGAPLDAGARLGLPSYDWSAAADGTHPELTQQARHPFEAAASGGPAEAPVAVSRKTCDGAIMNEAGELAAAAARSDELPGVY